jgi:hypothetical protein
VVQGVRAVRGPHVTPPAWLDGVQCTKPFTVDDARELHGMLKRDMPGHAVDVYTRGDIVHVRVFASPRDMTPVFSRDFEAR